ncbi:unnamed protein product [Caenorhabditis brenneri]
MASTRKIKMPTGYSSTTESDDTTESPMTPGYVYIIVEVAYLLVFAISAYMLRRYNFMKTDDDAVTKHHRRHYEIMKEQQAELIKEQTKNENFLVGRDVE